MCFIYIPILSQRHRICILIFRNYTHRQHKFLSAINFNLPSSMNSPPFDSNLVRFPNLWWHSTSTYRHLPMGGFRGRYIPNWLIWYRHIIQTSSLAIYIRPKHTWQYRHRFRSNMWRYLFARVLPFFKAADNVNSLAPISHLPNLCLINDATHKISYVCTSGVI